MSDGGSADCGCRRGLWVVVVEELEVVLMVVEVVEVMLVTEEVVLTVVEPVGFVVVLEVAGGGSGVGNDGCC